MGQLSLYDDGGDEQSDLFIRLKDFITPPIFYELYGDGDGEEQDEYLSRNTNLICEALRVFFKKIDTEDEYQGEQNAMFKSGLIMSVAMYFPDAHFPKGFPKGIPADLRQQALKGVRKSLKDIKSGNEQGWHDVKGREKALEEELIFFSGTATKKSGKTKTGKKPTAKKTGKAKSGKTAKKSGKTKTGKAKTGKKAAR